MHESIQVLRDGGDAEGDGVGNGREHVGQHHGVIVEAGAQRAGRCRAHADDSRHVRAVVELGEDKGQIVAVVGDVEELCALGAELLHQRGTLMQQQRREGLLVEQAAGHAERGGGAQELR